MSDLIRREDAIKAIQCVTDSPNFSKALGELYRIPSVKQTEPSCENCKRIGIDKCFGCDVNPYIPKAKPKGEE